MPRLYALAALRSVRGTHNMIFRMLFPLMLLLIGTGQSAAEQASQPVKFFREYVELSDDQIRAIHSGKAVAKVLPSRTPDEVFVFGAVYVESTPERYLKLASDVDALRKLPTYLAIRKFSDPPKLSDLDGFGLEKEDIKDLKDCKPGDCEVQLPSEVMDTFRQSINWSAPDRDDQVNRMARQTALDALSRYMQGGNAALGTYRDKNHPAEVAETFQSLLSFVKALPVYLPELHTYLLDYPKVKSGNIDSAIYWEKVNFGLKPTLRLVQVVVYRGESAAGPVLAVAQKQLYASHYFQTALDLTVCLRDTAHPEQRGFYMITLKGSKQAGLTGFKGSIVRKKAVDKTRSSMERGLASLKQELEMESGASSH